MKKYRLTIIALSLLVGVHAVGCSDDGGGEANNGAVDAGQDVALDDSGAGDVGQDVGPDAAADAGPGDVGDDADMTDAGGDVLEDVGGDVLVDAGSDAGQDADVAPPPPDDLDPLLGEWSDNYSAPGLIGDDGGEVTAMVHDDSSGAVYAAGSYTVAGTVAAANVSKWNGSSWEALGQGLPSPANTLAVADDGTLYAGGNGTSGGFIGRPQPAPIFAWDGSQWAPFAAADGDAVVDIVPTGSGEMIVAGAFSAINQTQANNIAKLTASGWEPVSADMQPDGPVWDVEPTNNGFCMIGDFANIGTLAANGAACWDGASWQPLGQGLSGAHALVSLGGGKWLAGGTFSVQDAAGNRAVGLAQWNGTEWVPYAGGVSGGQVTDVRTLHKTAGGSIYVGGTFTYVGPTATPSPNIAKLDGTTWTAMGQGVNETLRITAGTREGVDAITTLANGDVIAGGFFSDASGTFAVNIARYDGANWNIFVNSDRAYLAVGGNVRSMAADSSGMVYAGGDFDYAGRADSTNIARLNGTSWEAMGEGLNDIVSTVAVSNGTVYAGGQFTFSGPNGVSYIAQWNGTAWDRLGGGVNGEVNDIAVGPAGELYAVGAFTVAAGQTVNGVAKWDGSTWSPMGAGFADIGSDSRDERLEAVAVDENGTVYVGGTVKATDGGKVIKHVAVWNGTEWDELGNGVTDADLDRGLDRDSSTVYDLAIWNGDLVLVGNFALAGGVTVNSVALWDGTSFHALGDGAPPRWEGGRPGTLFSVDAKENGVFVAGGTETLGAATVNFVGWWDGTSWHALDEGVNDAAESVFVHDYGLFVGGPFTNASGKPSFGMARWDYAQDQTP